MSTTKLELQQTNARLARENEELRVQVANSALAVSMLKDNAGQDATYIRELLDEVQALHAQLLNVTSVASAINTVNTARPTQPQWQKDRAQAMAAAKDMAQRSRMVVKV